MKIKYYKFFIFKKNLILFSYVNKYVWFLSYWIFFIDSSFYDYKLSLISVYIVSFVDEFIVW